MSEKRKIVEYINLICDVNNDDGGAEKALSELDELVNFHINSGWQPLGGLCATPETDSVEMFVMQSMVRY